MIKVSMNHIAQRIYGDPLITESGGVQYIAKDANGFSFIFIYDRVPITTDDYRHPKEILDPSIVPALINLWELADAIDDEIHNQSVVPTNFYLCKLINAIDDEIRNSTVEISREQYQTKWLKYLKGE